MWGEDMGDSQASLPPSSHDILPGRCVCFWGGRRLPHNPPIPMHVGRCGSEWGNRGRGVGTTRGWAALGGLSSHPPLPHHAQLPPSSPRIPHSRRMWLRLVPPTDTLNPPPPHDPPFWPTLPTPNPPNPSMAEGGQHPHNPHLHPHPSTGLKPTPKRAEPPRRKPRPMEKDGAKARRYRGPIGP